MKFASLQAKQEFLSEIERLDLLAVISETWEPSAEMEELFIRKRKKLVPKLKDFRKSQDTKSAWRGNRWKYLSGLRTFHSSTLGKRFHRELGRFLSTRCTGNEAYDDVTAFVKATSSAVTHLHIENEYYHPLMEQIEFEVFYEVLYDALREIEHKAICEGFASFDADDIDFLIRITENAAQIKSFAEISGKTEQEVEKYWDEAKASVKLEYGKDEEDSGFWSLVVGIVKHRCGLDTR